MTFRTGCPSQKFGQLFLWAISERGFCPLTFLKGKKSTLSNMVILHIIGMQTLHWLKNANEYVSENQYLRLFHGIIDSICKSHLIAQAKKQYDGVFLYDYEYGKKLLWRSKI